MPDDTTITPFSTPLQQAFAEALGRPSLSEAETEFILQAGDDLRPDELAGVEIADLAANLAGFWRFGETNAAAGPALRLVPATATDGRELGFDLLQIVQPDAPFLVDSVMGELSAGGYDVRALTHPVVKCAGGARSMILVALDDVGEDRHQPLLHGLEQTLADVRLAVDDFQAMQALMRETADGLRRAPAPPGPYPVEEYLALLDWLSERFVFLGARVYEYPRTADGAYAAEEPRFGPQDCLGVLRDPARSVLRRASEPAILTPELNRYLADALPIMTAKSTLRSRVHRRAYMDYVGVRRYDDKGAAIGEVRFVGLFTVEAYEEAARDIPLVRWKVDNVLERAGAQPSQHNAKQFRHIVETYPRDELFQVDEETLYRTASGILHLYDRPRVGLFTRADVFDRFVSCLLYVPRDRYDSDVSKRAGRMLAAAFGGHISAAFSSASDQPLAQLHFVIGVTPGDHLHPDLKALEAELTEVVRTWSDRFEAAARRGGIETAKLGETLARYAGAFPPGYRDAYDAAEALADLKVIEGMGGDTPLRIRAYRRPEDSKTQFRFKLYHAGQAVPLAGVLPVLENMGLKAIAEQGFPITRSLAEGPQAQPAPTVTWVHDFLLEDERGERLTFADVRCPFEDCFLAVWEDRTENDGFNRLVLELGTGWREAALLRALARYRQQSGLDPSEAVQQATLRDHSEITRLILDMFQIKFDPALHATPEQRAEQAEEVFQEIVEALQAVESLDADRVLRRLALLVRALVRTNFHQEDADGAPKPYISFKIASRELEDLPAPKPFREIFVWAPHVEGVHLRFGPVARGGLRWSDRRDDFRTEVLGLVKAQQVKNAVIVPVGSKGGFYPKRLPRTGGQDAVRAEAVRAYRTFLSGLLDITDNLDPQGAVIRPQGVIAHDGDDPYLVVAADKGTATFSDIANGVAESYGFWLGDAFASGGSAGYDHKVMGITARGAWEAVKRHFREMGRDIQSEPFTCVGVGDMSGDVFGNGALLSRAMKLVAAFDHRHIFLDPDPDPERSWTERKRLFDLPRSSWDDYDRTAMSTGGGVFARTAKTIAVSPEVRALLDLDAETLTPPELIRAILKARVDLLYLGGIGTYVKAPGETQAEAGDKANDPVRIDATELRCAVVGEGANLGVTQAGRIAFARLGNGGRGGRINTDAIDNSAGVDTSDHEVNIKILLGQAERNGHLARADRNALLASMTDDVAVHVLAHNYNQTLGLSLQEADAAADLDAYVTFMAEMEASGRLNRKVEGLPGPTALAELRAQDKGLARPELAVLTAYGKLELSAEVVAGDAPDDPYFLDTLHHYFPRPLGRFADEMARHQLRREIVATVLSNELVDMIGPTFPERVMHGLGCDASAVVRAFEAARRVFRFDEAWTAINALDLKAPWGAQLALYQEVAHGLRSHTFWLARRAAGLPGGVQALIDAYRPAVDLIRSCNGELLSPAQRQATSARLEALIQAGAPEDMARTVANLGALGGAAEIADLARETHWPVDAMARLYNEVGDVFGFDRLQTAAAAMRGRDHYERIALRGLMVELVTEQAARTRAVADRGDPGEGPDAALAAWIEPRRAVVERAQDTLARMEQGGDPWSFAKLTLATAALRGLGDGAV